MRAKRQERKDTDPGRSRYNPVPPCERERVVMIVKVREIVPHVDDVAGTGLEDDS
jgi:hypothetical protein